VERCGTVCPDDYSVDPPRVNCTGLEYISCAPPFHRVGSYWTALGVLCIVSIYLHARKKQLRRILNKANHGGREATCTSFNK